MLKGFHRIPGLRKCYSSLSNPVHPQARCKWASDPNDIRNILCDGPILHAVQMSNVFPDCKTFVDMNVKTSIPAIHDAWKTIAAQYGDQPVATKTILKFLQDHFETVEGDSQLEKWVPTDWKPNPKILEKVEDPEYKYFAKELNLLWLKLGRKMNAKVQTESNKTTLLYVPHGFIIPGGRFRELYYWDTYFILLGLLVCDMFETAKGIIENMVHLLKTHGSIYNGTRLYYQFRSQPPLLLKMVDDYVNVTKDFSMVEKNFRVLEKEILCWETTRRIDISVGGEKYDVFRYHCCTPGPRPESYREDIATAEKCSNDEVRMYKYQAIASACESGWDFSSRWFKFKKGSTLQDMHTQEIIPVDLNAFMHMNYEIMKKWATQLKMSDEVKKYTVLSDKIKVAIHDLLWDELDGIWYDRDIRDGSLNKEYVTSNFTPLWTRSFNDEAKVEIAERMLEYYTKYNLWKFKGGLPTTMCFSGEQWDWPNSWAPLQLIASQGFRNVGLPVLGFKIASNWVNNNYTGYLKHGVIFEKYDCRRPGMTGFGGEYEEQVGFGWSNGVLFQFMHEYPDKLRPHEE
uniref:Trehalase n=1 Tax=Lygus hesperus TaxID=30085 RepID=A0A0A9Y0X3_LYGHE